MICTKSKKYNTRNYEQEVIYETLNQWDQEYVRSDVKKPYIKAKAVHSQQHEVWLSANIIL